MKHFETVRNKQTYTHHTNLHFQHGPYTETKTLVTSCDTGVCLGSQITNTNLFCIAASGWT